MKFNNFLQHNKYKQKILKEIKKIFINFHTELLKNYKYH